MKPPNESPSEQIERVRLMAAGDSTWDLSDNDIAALKTVMQYVAAIQWLDAHPFTAYRSRDPETGKLARTVVVDEDAEERRGHVRETLLEALSEVMG